MTFEVISDNPKECSVVGDGKNSIPCIDAATTGKVTVPETVAGFTVVEVGWKAFSGTSVEEVILPPTIRKLQAHAFSYCSNMKRCLLPESLEEVSYSSFFDDKALEMVYLPHSLKNVGHSMFCWCSNLKSIVIPKSVTKIERSAFQGCSQLGTIVFLGETCPEFGTNVFSEASILTNPVSSGSTWEYDPKIDIYEPNRDNSAYDTVLPGMFDSEVSVNINHTLANSYIPIYDRSTMGYMVRTAITGYDENTNEYTCYYYGATEAHPDFSVATHTAPHDRIN